LRLLRVLKLKRLLGRFEEVFLDEKVVLMMQVLKLFSFIFFIAHWIACFFYAIADLDSDESGVNWIAVKGLTDSDNFTEKYLTALYWSFMTMTTVGYGDVVPY
jgi:hypothetical protein